MSIRVRLGVVAFIGGAGLMVAACSSSGATPTTAGATGTAALQQAVSNTVSAPNYSEVLSQTTPQGKQTDYLKYQAPDRLGGYVQSGSSRVYVYVIGSTEYQSQSLPNNSSTKNLTFQSKASQGATASDPVHGYLPYVTQAKHPNRSGDSYSFTLTKQGQTGTFTYTVNGRYISRFTLSVPKSSVRVDISAVGTSPPVSLPSGSSVSPASSAPTTTPSP
jgi:hypothetical protein